MHQLTRDFRLSVLSYDHDTIAPLQRNKVQFLSKIMACTEWNIICLDPEHLTSKDWRTISECESFTSNLVQCTVDELHLIDEWGRDFRIAFRIIGKFIRGRFPTRMSVVGLTATLLPGEPTLSVCKSLGFFRGSFNLVRRSNERTNMQLSILTASKGFSGHSFPDLLPYLNQNRKTVISCQSLDVVYRVLVYLISCLPDDMDPFTRIRPYHALLPATYNQESIELMETNLSFMVIISTVALSFGINISTVLDNIGIDFPTTVETWVQEKGRAGRMKNVIARGISFVTKQTIAAAKKGTRNVFLHILKTYLSPCSST
jgi:superfamily II DNA helicase RecQ